MALPDWIPNWLPVALAAGSIVAGAATSQAQVHGLQEQVDRMDEKGTDFGRNAQLRVETRLTKIETQLDGISEQLDRIEGQRK